ncbi:hypothetical protein BH11PLA1_BH11PLA1_10640 [soil metagenome]
MSRSMTPFGSFAAAAAVSVAASLAAAAGLAQPKADSASISGPGSGSALPSGMPAGIPEGATIAGTSQIVPVFVRAVQGKVRYMEKGGTIAKLVEVGTVLPEGCTILTGLKSAVQVQVGAGQIFTIDAATQVTLKEVVNKGGAEKTALDMPYGRVTFDVTSTKIANDVTITAPDATLAVKGTSGGISSRPGFETQAFGGAVNKGRFDVTYNTRLTSIITGSEKATSRSPSPALLAREKQFVDTGASKSRDSSESKAVSEQGAASPVTVNSPTQRLIGADDAIRKPDGTLFGDTFFDLSNNGGSLFQRDGYFNYRREQVTLSGVQGAVQGATVVTSGNGHQVLLVIDNVFGPNGNTPFFRSLDLTAGQTSYNTLGSIAPFADFGGFTSYTLFGLASIQNHLFTAGNTSSSDLGHIFEVGFGGFGLLGDGKGGAKIENVMDLDIHLQPAMASAPSRGTLFVIGQNPGNGGGKGGPINGNWVLYEINPLTATIVNTFTSDGKGGNDFANQPTTSGPPGYMFSQIQQVTGMIYINGLLILSGRTADNRPITIYYNPDAANTPQQPAVVYIDGTVYPYITGTLANVTPVVGAVTAAPGAVTTGPALPTQTETIVKANPAKHSGADFRSARFAENTLRPAGKLFGSTRAVATRFDRAGEAGGSSGGGAGVPRMRVR